MRLNESKLMIDNGASSRRAKDLAVPEYIRLAPLTAYAPETNPNEQVWDELRESARANPVFKQTDALAARSRAGLPG